MKLRVNIASLKKPVAILSSILVMASLFILVYARSDSPEAQARINADSFVELIQQDRTVEAYELSSSVFQQNTTYLEFEEAVKGLSRLLPNDVIFVGDDFETSDEGIRQAAFTYSSKGIDEIDYKIIVIEIEQLQRWQILNFTIEPL